MGLVGTVTNVLTLQAYSKKFKNAMLMVKYIAAGLEDSLKEPILCKTFVIPDSLTQL